ncbi:MAG: iron-sulfur cluster assembly accessory protein [Phycisphaerales bacterium]|nr:MAG: iron-sulfur cluster assembly accessory protein [Phycisphaerales bacterium]
MERPKAMTLTDAAAARVKELMARAGGDVMGVRIGVTMQGCSGMSYKMEYAKEERPFEEVVEDKGVKVLIDPAATMFLLGSEMDWVEDKLSSRFVFNNPNVKGTCGCGESFHI